MTMPLLSRCLLLLLAYAPCVALCERDPEDVYRQERAEFVRAYTAVTRGENVSDPASDRLRTYPLYPYLQAARLARAVSETPLDTTDERVETFLTYYANEPVARDLRRIWLTSLADRQQWSRFLANYVDASADDALRCRSFSARIGLQRTQGLVADISAQWLTPQTLQECAQAFDWLRAQNALSVDLIERRARLSLEKGNTSFARQIIAMLPPDRAAPLQLWARLLDKPRTIDEVIAAPDKPVEPAALLAGWTKLARTDRDAALARFDRLVRARNWSAREASPYALALALPLSWDRRSEALKYFALVDPADLDDSALEWQARAALWARNWPLVSRTIESMSAEQRAVARWRYWSARAAENSKDPQTARQLYRSLLLDDNYYSAMAAARLGETVVPQRQNVPVDRKQLGELNELPAFVRARELYWSALRPQALTEWLYGYATLSETARLQAIHLASQWGWHDQAVATATQQRVFNDYELLYPRPYDREVQSAARLTGLAPNLIYGLMRQESLYRADALSSAGARGLLQLVPETARHTARRWQKPQPSADDLFDPHVNVSLGAGHLRMLLDRFGGQTPVALAGYNAGPNAAIRWLPSEAMDSDIWIENIPYNETRTYVQRVLWHSVVFAWLDSGKGQRTQHWITRIGPNVSASIVASES